MIVTAGIDPGFATMGLAAVVRNSDGSLDLLEVTLVRTDKGTKKEMVAQRVSADDQRRLSTLWKDATSFLERWRPGLVGIEVYSPYKRQGGSAWKSSLGFSLACCAAMANNAIVQPYLPLDLRRGLSLAKDASKKDVEIEMCSRFPKLSAALSLYPKGVHEHLCDAAAYAYLAMVEATKLARITGFGG